MSGGTGSAGAGSGAPDGLIRYEQMSPGRQTKAARGPSEWSEPGFRCSPVSAWARFSLGPGAEIAGPREKPKPPVFQAEPITRRQAARRRRRQRIEDARLDSPSAIRSAARCAARRL
jgi:hypothetical protein